MPLVIQNVEYYSKAELSARGWSPEMMVTLLPKNERKKRNLPSSSGNKVQYYWPVASVLAAEASDEWRELSARAKEKRRRKAARREAKNALKRQIRELSVDANPQDAYPEARRLARRFILHIGPTNSGKTYDALQRLKQAENGVYLGPLRLLALEVYDRFTDDGILCNMITGEESIFDPAAQITASTIEIMDTERHYAVAVVDEAQMIADPFRGYNWTRALLGLCADEIHVCMAPEAEDIVKAVIDECEDEYEVVYHQRKTPLSFDKGNMSMDDVQRGDALVVFSRRAVLSLSAALARHHIRASVIYGDLPPASRREQVHRFAAGETDVVVSTDAIGMGLNLAIRRIVFVETKKFDGTEFRLLQPCEIKQIAGRAGRYGLSEHGYVKALEHESHVRNALNEPVDPIDIAYLGFPEKLLELDGELMYLMHEWKKAPTEKFYVKMDLSEIETMYQYLQEHERETFAALDKRELYDLLTCSVNIKNGDMMAQWALYCREHHEGYLQFTLPLQATGNDLQALETEYHCLDLYYQITRKTRRVCNESYLRMRKTELEFAIDEQLLRFKNRTSRRCRVCGKYLHVNNSGGYCPDCENRWNRTKKSK